MLLRLAPALLGQPFPQDGSVVETARVPDAQPGEFARGQGLEIVVEFLDATVAETAPGPKGPRRAEVVVNMHAIGARLDGLDDALPDVLAEERLPGAAPPKRDSLVLQVAEPGNLVRLAVQAAAQALFVGLRKPFVVAAELGDHSDAAEELRPLACSSDSAVGLPPQARTVAP